MLTFKGWGIPGGGDAALPGYREMILAVGCQFIPENDIWFFSFCKIVTWVVLSGKGGGCDVFDRGRTFLGLALLADYGKEAVRGSLYRSGKGSHPYAGR